MSDLIVYFPADDLDSSIAAATKRALMDLSNLHIPCPGFTDTSDGSGYLNFPDIGVDFRTVTVSGNTMPLYPQVFTDSGMVARMRVDPADVGNPLTVSAYSRYSTYIVGNLDDLPFDLFTWVGDPAGADKRERSVPIMIPVIRDSFLVRQSARGEYVRTHGYFCIYGGANQGGISNVKSETSKLYRAIKTHGNLFTTNGLTQMLVEPPKYQTYTKDSVLYEGVIPFSCMARIS